MCKNPIERTWIDVKKLQVNSKGYLRDQSRKSHRVWEDFSKGYKPVGVVGLTMWLKIPLSFSDFLFNLSNREHYFHPKVGDMSVRCAELHLFGLYNNSETVSLPIHWLYLNTVPSVRSAKKKGENKRDNRTADAPRACHLIQTCYTLSASTQMSPRLGDMCGPHLLLSLCSLFQTQFPLCVGSCAQTHPPAHTSLPQGGRMMPWSGRAKEAFFVLQFTVASLPSQLWLYL